MTGEKTVRPCAPDLLRNFIGRATRTWYKRRQVGDTRTLMRSVGSATIADLLLTSVTDRTRTKIPTIHNIFRRPDSDEIRRPDSTDFHQTDLNDFHQATPDNCASLCPVVGVAGNDVPQDRRVVLIRTATRKWVKNTDDDLSATIPLEEKALVEWMMGDIVLSSPTGFLVCMCPRATRVVMFDIFEAYSEGKVIAIASPYLLMPQYIAEKTLLLQLLERRDRERNPKS